MNGLAIAGRGLRTDADGRVSLNDCHRAAGGEDRHRPSRWLANAQTKELIAELETDGIPAVSTSEGRRGGTLAAEQLVIAYAAWISPRFHLQVVNTFLAVRKDQDQQANAIPAGLDARIRRLEEQAARTASLDHLTLPLPGAICLTEAAKLLQQKPRAFLIWMAEARWIYRATDWGTWRAHQRRIDDGYLCHVMVPIVRTDGRRELQPQVKVTPRGLARLAELLGNQTPTAVPTARTRR